MIFRVFIDEGLTCVYEGKNLFKAYLFYFKWFIKDPLSKPKISTTI